MFTKDTYVNRRKRLKELVGSGLVLILGNNDSPFNYPDNTYHYRQDSTFLYFFGVDCQGFAGVIDVDNDNDILFGDDVTMDGIIWMGPQPKVSDRGAQIGVSDTRPMNELQSVVRKAVTQGRKVHFTPPYRGENIMLLADLLGLHHGSVADYASRQLIDACIALRSVKEQCEIDEMERHMSVAYQMHTTAMKLAKEGVSEQYITGIIEGISMSGGGVVSFPVICSVRGETLHNHYHGNILRKGQLLLVDAGSESPMHYATDHTRTTPVGGVFNQQQKEIYDIVLNASNISREATKPGVFYRDVHLLASKTIASGLKDLGIMKGDIDEAVKNGAHALFMPHGLGHMIGLDVHDMEDYNDTLVGYDHEIERSTQFGLKSLRMGRRLHEGFVITNEPGIYFIPALIDSWKADKKFMEFINYDKLDAYRSFGGVRLEDDILVTKDGCRILGDRIPITTDEVEAMAASK